ncbi:MAG: hypothetical protein WAK34_13680 [Rhodoplanes sp.]
MSEYKIAVIVGSLRRDSFNRKLADGLMKLSPADFSFHERLRLVCATGEKFYIDLQRDRAGAILEAIDRAIAPEPHTFGVLPIDPPGD